MQHMTRSPNTDTTPMPITTIGTIDLVWLFPSFISPEMPEAEPELELSPAPVTEGTGVCGNSFAPAPGSCVGARVGEVAGGRVRGDGGDGGRRVGVLVLPLEDPPASDGEGDGVGEVDGVALGSSVSGASVAGGADEGVGDGGGCDVAMGSVGAGGAVVGGVSGSVSGAAVSCWANVP